jgi:hypothetical protein
MKYQYVIVQFVRFFENFNLSTRYLHKITREYRQAYTCGALEVGIPRGNTEIP